MWLVEENTPDMYYCQEEPVNTDQYCYKEKRQLYDRCERDFSVPGISFLGIIFQITLVP